MKMASIELTRYMRMVPALMSAPHGFIWSSYDQEADVLYINFKKPASFVLFPGSLARWFSESISLERARGVRNGKQPYPRSLYASPP